MTIPAAAPAPAVPTSPAASAAANVQAEPIAAKAEKSTVRVKSHERAKRVKEQLAESPSEPAAERETQAPRKESSSAADSDGEPAKAAEKPAVIDDAEKRRAERAERMRRARERERSEDEARKSKTQGKTTDAELEKLRKRIAELEPHEQVFASEEALLAAAEAKGMSVEKLVQWMRTRLSDPAAVAQRHAKTEADKLREEIAAVKKAHEESIASLKAEREQERAQTAGQNKAATFIGAAKEKASSHPCTAALVKRHGDNGLIAFANQFVAPLLRADYSVEELHDHVEQFLEEVQVASASSPGNPANGTSHPAKNGAVQPTTTLSNGLASERVSVTEETPLARLPRRERIRRAREKYASE
jgi:hypothetical protein